MAKELDYMEYASDVAAQSAYVTDGNLTYSADRCTGGTAISSCADPNQPASYAFDNDLTLRWYVLAAHNDAFITNVCYIGYDFGSDKTITKVRYAAYNDYTPSSVTIKYSDNGSDWTTLQSFTIAAGGLQSYRELVITNESSPHRYWGVFANSQAAINGLTWVVSEIEMLETTGIELQSYSENTIKEQGLYSLKVVAIQTDSLNDTLTKSGLAIDLTGINTLEIWVYASRTGANIEIRIHDSGGTTTTKSIVISSADTWEKTTWDISGVSNNNKDDIDSIIVKITNADAENTFYLDNFFGIEITVYPTARLNKNRITGYHCFMDAYLRAVRLGFEPLKLPDGSIF